MTVQLGINPLTWTNDDLPSLGGETPLETCLSEGKLAGFAGFELGHKFPNKANKLKPILDGHNLQLVSGWFSGQLLERSVREEIIAIKDHLTLLKDMGCKVMVYCEITDCVHGQQETAVTLRKPFPAQRWDEYAEKINALAKYTLSQGVQLAYHHHMGTVIQTEAEIDELMQRTDPALGLLLDSGHLYFSGADPVAVAKRWSARINHVHCKDIRKDVLTNAQNANLSFLNSVLNGVFTVPGEGCIDYKAIFTVLNEANYQGWLVVEAEQDPVVAHPLTYAMTGYINLRELAQSTNLI